MIRPAATAACVSIALKSCLPATGPHRQRILSFSNRRHLPKLSNLLLLVRGSLRHDQLLGSRTYRNMQKPRLQNRIFLLRCHRGRAGSRERRDRLKLLRRKSVGQSLTVFRR